jgi:hypothetical protein
MNVTDLNLSALKMPVNPCETSAGVFSPECLIKNFCPQINHYFVTYGLGIIIFWVVFSWLWWAFKKWGIRRLDWDKWLKDYSILAKITGDLRIRDRVIYWDYFIYEHFIKFCIGFIAVMVYFFL